MLGVKAEVETPLSDTLGVAGGLGRDSGLLLSVGYK